MKKLSVSNIGWEASQDAQVYRWMEELGFTGLEIAPTRIFPQAPYDRLSEAAAWAKELKNDHGFSVPSMQSIWFGRQEPIFGEEAQRQSLLDYTKKAMDFASVIGCRNLVFGCPRNRNVPQGMDPAAAWETAVEFFRTLGGYALEKGTVLAMEANPPIYNTNFINTTAEALELVKAVNSDGFLLNLDLGTMIHNGEDPQILRGNVSLIHHVHISEPGLKPIVSRPIHREVVDILKNERYQGFLSIEMGKQPELAALHQALSCLEVPA